MLLFHCGECVPDELGYCVLEECIAGLLYRGSPVELGTGICRSNAGLSRLPYRGGSVRSSHCFGGPLCIESNRSRLRSIL